LKLGGPFFPAQDFTYTVLFGDQPADLVTKVQTDQSILNVTTPTRQRIVGEVPVKVLLNGNILDPNSNLSFTFFRESNFFILFSFSVNLKIYLYI
jgi:hypothetical protein